MSLRGSLKDVAVAAVERHASSGAVGKPGLSVASTAPKDVGGEYPGTDGAGSEALTALKQTLKGSLHRQVDSATGLDTFEDVAPLPAYQPPEPEIRRGSAIQALRRALVDVQRDLQAVRGGSVELTDADLFSWEAALVGPPESPYRGGVFRFLFRFPADYPSGKVRVRCVTPMFHCNIDSNGTVCLGDPSDSNGGQVTAPSIIRVLLSLLRLPQPEHALVHTAASLFERDRVAYDLAARAWTLQHAF